MSHYNDHVCLWAVGVIVMCVCVCVFLQTSIGRASPIATYATLLLTHTYVCVCVSVFMCVRVRVCEFVSMPQNKNGPKDKQTYWQREK